MTIENTAPESADSSTLDSSDDYVEVVTERKKTTEEKLKTANAEARQYRKRAEAIEAERAEDLRKAEADKRAANEKLEKVERAYREKHVTSELKAYAIKANIVDLDDLAMVDRSKAEFDSDGNITNANALIEEFRTAKPHKFSSQTSVAAAMPKPKETTNDAPDWNNMSPEERKARRKAIGFSKY